MELNVQLILSIMKWNFNCIMKYKHQFLKFVKDDNVYYKYYDAFYILFHTGLRISEFCGLTINDIDLDNRIINIDHQLQRTSKMEYIIDSTKTKAGTRKIPMTEDVYETFRRILKERPRDLPEKMVDGYIHRRPERRSGA